MMIKLRTHASSFYIYIPCCNQSFVHSLSHIASTMSFEHYGRGSEANGIHFYQTIQLRQLQDQELMIPRNFVERYWKDVPNPISLRLPNESVCKMFWVQWGDDIYIQDWKRFARSLRCGDLLVFQYKGGSDFHVIILDESKLEIDYSSMRYNDDQEEEQRQNIEQPVKKKKINSNDSVATPQETHIDKRKLKMNATQRKISEIYVSSMRCNNEQDKESDVDDYAEIANEGENTKQPFKKKKINPNDSAGTPQGTGIDKRKINMNATLKKVLEANRNRGGSKDMKVKKCTKTIDANKISCTDSHPDENPNFTLKLSRSYVEGHHIRLRIPLSFSKEYMNEFLQGNATIRSVGDERTWNVTLKLDGCNGNFEMRTGWKSFLQEHNLQVGDECKFEMTQRKPLLFTITIIPATKESCPERFQENQPIQEDMDHVGNYGEGISRGSSKTHDSPSPISHYKFEVSVTSLDKVAIPSEFLKRHNIFSGNLVELKVGEGTWFVEVNYNQHLDYGSFTKGWEEFVRESQVKIGDTCLFEMIDVQNHVFKVSIILDV
ncbi:B3 domain-containing protein REM-like 1 isoform X2 [Trifolium pratense]|uniref:B3 domain-containing protein REM-like 1 isoform X2 n=1 Tax=Trifolium pratense TaxID=57577 RepID=UPI001E694481|nr:B3 domain-containing protein REM-like 1 isoform X2 [Trifolium pratense]